jgi:hypothetical protein
VKGKRVNQTRQDTEDDPLNSYGTYGKNQPARSEHDQIDQHHQYQQLIGE